MATVTARFPHSLVSEIDRLVGSGRFVSRSEAIRAALRALLLREKDDRARRREIEAFGRRVRELARDPRWSNRWVALHRGDPIDSDSDRDVLLRRILERQEDPVHIVFAGEAPGP